MSKILGQIRDGERIDSYETGHKTKDGRLIQVSLTVSPVRNTAGDVIGASTIARDITDRKLAEEKLRASRQFFANIFESIQEGVSVLDGEAKYRSSQSCPGASVFERRSAER